MPAPNTGSLTNGNTLLLMFGEPVVFPGLPGSPNRRGIHKTYNILEEEGLFQAARRYTYRLWMPEEEVGDLVLYTEGQRVRAVFPDREGQAYNIVALEVDGDHWHIYTITKA